MFRSILNRQSGRFWGGHIICLMVGLSVVVVYSVTFGRYSPPWMGDAAKYVQATRSLLHGHPLLLHTYEGSAPIRLWPPGYPVLAALAAQSGIDAARAALLVTQVALALIPISCFWALTPAYGLTTALCTSVICLTAPGLLPESNIAMSDSVFLLLAILTLGCVIRGRFLLAGLLAGAALCVHNSAIALILASCIAAAADDLNLQKAGASLLRIAQGALLPIAVLAAWNYWALGTFTPYSMPPSTSGIWQNLHDMSTAITFDMIPFWQASRATPWIVVLPICGGLSAFIITGALFGAPPGSLQRRAGITLGTYFCLGISMIIYARTRYQWGSGSGIPIGIRNASYYDWLLVPALAVTLCFADSLIHRQDQSARSAIRLPPIVILCAVVGIVMGLRFYNTIGSLHALEQTAPYLERIVVTGEGKPPPQLQTRQIYLAYSKIKPLGQFVQTVSPDCRLVSNLYDMLVALYDVPVTSTTDWQSADRPEPTVVVLASPDSVPSSNSGFSHWFEADRN